MKPESKTTSDRCANPRNWEEWKALFILEHDQHGKPFGEVVNPEDYRDFFDNEIGPHAAIEEAFNDGCN